MEKKKSEIGLLGVIWMGFSFIAGITFTASFSTIIASKDQTMVGGHMLWILAIEGAIAFMCAWAFAKLVKVHPQANGGGSQYTRTAFGKFAGMGVGILNYAFIPLIVMSLMVTMIRANFASGDVADPLNLAGYSAKDGFNGSWGAWGNLYLDIIAFAVFAVASCVIFLGIRRFKWVSIIIGYVTWAITLFIAIIAIISFAQNGTTAIGGYFKDTNLGFKSFSSAFTTSFFAFCGIETFIVTGNNIKDRNKTMPKAIIVILILVTLFYIIFTLLILGAVTGGFGSNPNLEIFGTQATANLKQSGEWIIIICTLLLRFNSVVQITLFAGSTLEPLARQHFIPYKVSNVNKENVPVAGAVTSIIIFSAAAALFLFVPDIIQGIIGQPSPFDYSQLSSTASILFMILYFVTIVICLLHGFKKNIKVYVWEYIGWFIALAVLIFLVFMYFLGLGQTLSKGVDNGNLNNFIGVFIQVGYMLIIIITILLLFFVYHKKEMKKVNENPEALKELQEYEKVFTISVPLLVKSETVE